MATLVHDARRIADEDLPRLRNSYFSLFWCFERIYAGRCTIEEGGRFNRRPLRFLDRLIGWQLEYWAEHLPEVGKELERRLGPLADTRSLRGFEDLKRAVLTVRV